MKKLVVYYSYTGNTKKIAKIIQEKLNCDILELTPKIPFSTDYQTVVDEYQNNSIDNKKVEINNINIDFSEYDEIIIGTPVWWYTISPVVTTFLKKYDLSTKKVYLFATNAGWLGRTFKDFEKLCTNAHTDECMNVVFDENNINMLKTSMQDINNWIEKL